LAASVVIEAGLLFLCSLEGLGQVVNGEQIQLLTSCVEEVLTSNWIVHRVHYISHFWRRHPCMDLLSYKPSYA
jgi:hypothetical protein